MSTISTPGYLLNDSFDTAILQDVKQLLAFGARLDGRVLQSIAPCPLQARQLPSQLSNALPELFRQLFEQRLQLMGAQTLTQIKQFNPLQLGFHILRVFHDRAQRLLKECQDLRIRTPAPFLDCQSLVRQLGKHLEDIFRGDKMIEGIENPQRCVSVSTIDLLKALLPQIKRLLADSGAANRTTQGLIDGKREDAAKILLVIVLDN